MENDMKQTFFVNLVSAGVFLCAQVASVALAQNPGSTMPSGQAPTTPQSTPGQSPGLNTPPTYDTMPSRIDDKRFAKDAAVGALMNVELGKLASQKASRDDIKQFGQKMVDDHTKANDQLKQLAGKENISLPDGLDSKHQSRVDKLSKLSGEDFDKAYVKDQLKDQQAQIRDFNAESQNGSDPNVKAFASNMLPTLQQNLELAKNLNKSEKNAPKNKGQ